MRIKKIFQKIFKGFFYWLFKKIYGPINNLNTQNNNFKILEINSKNIINFYNQKYKIYNVPNGRIYTDYVEHVGIIDKNYLCNEVSYQQIKGELKNSSFNICIKNGTPRIKKYFKGRTLNLAQGASGHSNYAHWLFDMLPKIKLYQEKYHLKDLTNIYVSKLNKFQKLSFEILNINDIKIIDSNKYRHIQSDEIIATQHPNYYKGYIMEEHKNLPDWIILWLRDVFLSKADKINPFEKIFIDRSKSKSNHCQIINLNKTIELLTNLDFKIVRLEELSLIEQISLFNKSKIIVGAHGAGFANLTFANRNIKVIEIRPINHPNRIYERISSINKLNYKLYSSTTENNSNFEGDININIDKLNSLIK